MCNRATTLGCGLAEVTWFGGAPWQRVVLPSYISAQCLEATYWEDRQCSSVGMCCWPRRATSSQVRATSVESEVFRRMRAAKNLFSVPLCAEQHLGPKTVLQTRALGASEGSSTFAGRVSERASLGNSRRNGFQLKKQCWHQ